MKFVFDLDGTLSFDYMTIDEEIKQVLLKAEDYGHEVVFASARSYRDCLGLLGPVLSQRLVIGLNGGVAYYLGKAIYERNLDARVYQALVDYCQTYNLPFFVDDCFDYSGQIVGKIPFISSVDPLKVARHQKLEDLGTPIKIVVYMGDHEDLLDDLLGQLERQGRLICPIMPTKSAFMSILGILIRRQLLKSCVERTSSLLEMTKMILNCLKHLSIQSR